MKRSWYLPFALEGILCTLLFWWQRPEDGTILSVLAQPLMFLGRGLRALSLSGAAGDLAAWCLYLILGLAPLGVLAFLLLRRRAGWEDGLLALLAGVLLWGVYYLVNPARLSAVLPEMGAMLCSQAIYAVAVSWAILRLLRCKDPAKLLQGLLNALAAVLVFAACGMAFGELLRKMEEVRRANTGGGLGLTNGILVLRYLAEASALLLDVWLIHSAQGLLAALSRDAYGQEGVDAAARLTRRCTLALRIVVISSLAVNLVQVPAFRSLRDVRLSIDLPLTSMVLILSLILLCRLLTRGKELKDDSDLII